MAENDPINFTVAPTKVQELLLQQSLLNSSELQADSTSAKSLSFRPNITTRRTKRVVLVRRNMSGVDARDYPVSPAQAASTIPYIILVVCLRRQVKNEFLRISDLQVPTFSLSPSEIVQNVSEGLLNLPRLFEVYANDDALSFSLETLPYINPDVLKGIPEEPHSELIVPPRHIRRTSLVSIQATPAPPVTLDAETVSSAWLSSLGHSLLSYLMNDILPKIPTLSEAGATQLTSDLSYLSNILGALNVSSEDLGKWQEYVGLLDADAGRAKLVDAEMQSDAIFQSVARMRGWRSAWRHALIMHITGARMQSLALPAIFFGLGGRIVLDMLTRSAESSFQEFLLLGVWEGVGVHCAFTYSDYGIIAAVGVALHLFVDFSGTQDLVRSFCTFIGVAAGVLSSEVLSNLINDNSKEHSKKRSYIDSYGDSHRDRAKEASKRKERGTYDSPRHKAFRQSHSDITSVDSNSELIHIRPFMTLGRRRLLHYALARR
ncbi:Golgi complex component domain-containing protein [Salix suchowensis]|nr:Golgi complex component domain-containing protein [Salix suchowensis]